MRLRALFKRAATAGSVVCLPSVVRRLPLLFDFGYFRRGARRFVGPAVGASPQVSVCREAKACEDHACVSRAFS